MKGIQVIFGVLVGFQNTNGTTNSKGTHTTSFIIMMYEECILCDYVYFKRVIVVHILVYRYMAT
jgi:hypothetical protein